MKIMKQTAWLAALALLTACAGMGGPAADPGATATAAAETITPQELLTHIEYLASDELRGRDTPSPGLEAAAAFLAGEFESYGLEPGAEDGSFIQRYPYPLKALGGNGVRLNLQGLYAGDLLEYGADYFVVPGEADSTAGSIVFTGTAASFAEGGAGALRDQVAAVYVPGRLGRDWAQQVGAARDAAEAAGAHAVLFVLDPAFDEAMVRRMTEYYGRPARELGGVQGIPAYFLRYTAAADLFRGAGLDLDSLLEEAMQGRLQPTALAGISAVMTAPVSMLDDATPPNVVAVLPGSDPELRDTYVVFSAHMDHVGVGKPNAEGDSIYNGADDDASGTSALLEIAEAFASLPERPARSLIFLAVSGEEKGLLGSQWYADHPTVPLESIVANFNMDMIGRNSPDSIVVIGQEYSSLGPLVHEVAERHPELGLTVAPDIWPEQRFFFRSDHFNFAKHEIPALFFFAGVHEDYHQPSDEPQDIIEEKVSDVARLVFYTAHAVATDRDRPEWTEEGLAEVRDLVAGGR